MVTKTKSVKSAVQSMYFTAEGKQSAIQSAPYDYEIAVSAGALSGMNERAIVMALFTKAELPTFKQYQEAYKVWYSKQSKADIESKKLPATVTRHTAGHGATYQVFNNAQKLREAESEGFNILGFWNEYAQTKKRDTQPNLGALLKGLRAFKKSTAEVDHDEAMLKSLKTAYTHSLERKGKKAQQDAEKIAALIISNGGALPKAEVDSDES